MCKAAAFIIPDFSIEKSAPSDSEGSLGQILRESGLISEVSQILRIHKKMRLKNPGYPAKQLKIPSGFLAAALRANFAIAKFGIIATGLFIVLGITQKSYADRRSYVWTYEYQTVPKGTSEIEYYLTTDVPDTAQSSNNTWKHWVELEHGLTNHWDVAMYQMWKQENSSEGSKFEYDGFKLRTRYRFGEYGKYFVDPELYFEYIRDGDFSKPNVGEGKLILGKDIGDLNISYNQIFERDLEKGKTEHEYAVGLSYALSPAFRLGIESKGSYSERESAIGPTISWATHKFWVSLGAVFGVNKRSNDLETRMIVGVPF